MGDTKISSSVASDIKTAFAQGTENYFEVDTQTTDSSEDQKETEWMNENYAQWLGYYKSIPEFKAVIDAKATWTVGKGYTADEETSLILDTIKGWGKDTFNTILENCVRTYQIGGDAFLQIIRDDEDNLINLKPLDPAVMIIIVNKQGMVIRYEQTSKVKGVPNQTFDPLDMFHLARNRVADEIHGQSLTESLVEGILRINEAKADWRRVLHHNVDPMIAYKLDTDDTTEIAAFKKKVDAAKGKGENMYLPKDSVEFEIISLAPNANLNPLPWIEAETDRFYEAAGTPKIIVGGSGGFTEAAVKIAYLAFQQTIEEEQLFIEEQILLQLNLVINLEFPASLENELISDKAKDETNGATQPNDTTATAGGLTSEEGTK